MHGRSSLILALLLLVFSLPAARPAVAAKVMEMTECDKSPFSGLWVTTDPDVRFLSKLIIKDVCKQIVTQPVASNNPWAGSLGGEKKYTHREYTLRASSTCSPMNCEWGTSKGELGRKGQLRVRFRMFWSHRFLVLKQENKMLRINWRIQYIGRKKPDQVGETLMVRAN